MAALQTIGSTLSISRMVMVAVTVTASLLLGVSVVPGASASQSTCERAATGSTVESVALACWQPASDENLSSVRETKAVAAAKKHNKVKGPGLRRHGAPTLLVSADGFVAVTWALTGHNISPSSQLIVLVGADDRFRLVEQNDFTMKSDGGMVHRLWQNKKLKTTTIYTAEELAQATELAEARAAEHGLVLPSGADSRALANASDQDCIALQVEVILFGVGVAIACFYMIAAFYPLGCLAAFAAFATLLERANAACPD